VQTCPEWYFWTPDGIVGDFFVMTQLTSGQIQSTCHESLLYQQSGETWQAKKLPQPVENPLDASERGEVLVTAIEDCGCCGWDNDSSNQLLLFKNGKVSVLYDEFSRFNNRNYDVNFYVVNAKLAPGNSLPAYTIASTAGTAGEIRLSSTGEENAEELARIRKTIAGLPAVDIIRPYVKPLPVKTIPRDALAGWLSDREILVAQNGQLVIYDVHGSKRKETNIRVRSGCVPASGILLTGQVSGYTK
jgi:hypothetical protein